MRVIIMAGGKGTRVAEINKTVPKPMIEIMGKPILEYQIELLKEQGFKEITIIVGHLREKIVSYFGGGENHGIEIKYIQEDEPLGTAGALFYFRDSQEDILLINGDIIFDMNLSKLIEFHEEHGAEATIVTHPNSHPYDSGIVECDKDSKVIAWGHKEEKRKWYRNNVNAGIHIIGKKVLKRFNELKRLDLDRDVLKPLIADGTLYSYSTTEYIKDMGTPDRYYKVVEDLQSGLVKRRNISRKQKAIFLDRDGTINKYVGFLTEIEKFELKEDVAKAIKLINDSEYLAIVVTNQPVVARGEVTEKELNRIHAKMETLLGNEGAYVNDIFYCPHHPDAGFDGEVRELKIVCNCRKPEIGLFLQAQEKYNIDLAQSWMVGDTQTDMLAGKRAGCKVAMVGKNPNYSCYDSLYNCIKEILGEEHSE